MCPFYLYIKYFDLSTSHVSFLNNFTDMQGAIHADIKEENLTKKEKNETAWQIS